MSSVASDEKEAGVGRTNGLSGSDLSKTASTSISTTSTTVTSQPLSFFANLTSGITITNNSNSTSSGNTTVNTSSLTNTTAPVSTSVSGPTSSSAAISTNTSTTGYARPTSNDTSSAMSNFLGNINMPATNSCFEFLLMELVPAMCRILTDVALRELRTRNATSPNRCLETREDEIDSSFQKLSLSTSLPFTSIEFPLLPQHEEYLNSLLPSINSAESIAALYALDPMREEIVSRLRSVGFRVGRSLVERHAPPHPQCTEFYSSDVSGNYSSASSAQFHLMDALDIIKFICKDLWTLLYRKQVDNLKTNHRGIFVLTDNKFRSISRISHPTAPNIPKCVRVPEQCTIKLPDNITLCAAQFFVQFPAGIILGALASFGYPAATVQAECTELPVAVFQVRVAPPPPNVTSSASVSAANSNSPSLPSNSTPTPGNTTHTKKVKSTG